MKKIAFCLLPIWLFAVSCEEAIGISIDEFIKTDRNVTALANAGGEAARICLAEHGEEHESTIAALDNAGAFYLLANEPQKALEAYGRSLGILQKGLGKEHKALAKHYHGAASALSALGRYDEAVQNFRAAIRCYELGGTKDAKDLMSCYAGFGNALYKAGDFSGAYVNHNAALRLFETVYGKDSEYFVYAMYHALLADDFVGLGDKQSALENYKNGLKILNKILEKDSKNESVMRLKSEIDSKIKKL